MAMDVKADELATAFLKNYKMEEDRGPCLANSAHFQALHASLINNHGTRVYSRAGWSTRSCCIVTNRYDNNFQNKQSRVLTQNMRNINWDNLKGAYLK